MLKAKPERIKMLMDSYVVPARLIMDIHTEIFDTEELLGLTFPIKYKQL